MKFGGTSVEDAAAVERVVGIVRAALEQRPVVVVSAMARVTDALLAAAARAGQDDAAGALADLDAVLARYRDAARRLLPDADRKRYQQTITATRAELAADLARVPRDPAAPDAVAAQGERLSAALVAAALAARAVPAREVDARRCILTDTRPGKAEPLIPETDVATRAALQPLIAAGTVPVLGGYMGATPEGVTTTLGRGGSDYSAALVGAALGAEEIQIWTDVSGVLTADPKVAPAARTITRLSFAEASELAYFGARVLHPKTILPAIRHGIPVRIRNSRAPDDAGTLVTAESEVVPRTVKAIAYKTGVSIVSVTSTRMLGAYGFLRALFEVFERQEAAPGRPNLPASTGAPARVVFSSHLDTVPPYIPAREDKEFLHGRGAYHLHRGRRDAGHAGDRGADLRDDPRHQRVADLARCVAHQHHVRGR